MTYTFKPDSGPSPRLDASNIQTNFAQWALKLLVNHVDMNLKFQGDHKKVVFVKQTIDPEVTQDLDVLYAKDYISNAGTQPQLFVRIPEFLPTDLDTTNATNDPMQLMYNTVNTAGPQYQSFLIGGYMIIFGMSTLTAVNNLTVNLSPAPKNLKAVLVNSHVISQNASSLIVSNSQFRIFTGPSTATGNFSWIAIGEA